MASPKPQPRSPLERGVVVDASVLLKLLLPEKESEAVRRQWGEWLEQDSMIAAPFLLAYEVVSVLRNKVFRGELPVEAGEAAFLAFQAQEISLLHPEGIEEKASGVRQAMEPPHGLRCRLPGAR